VALGISTIVEHNLPTVGAEMAALALATVAINQVIGPILFKLALDRTGESRNGASAEPAA
jgi:hypothetical protein